MLRGLGLEFNNYFNSTTVISMIPPKENLCWILVRRVVCKLEKIAHLVYNKINIREFLEGFYANTPI
jgi:hypothetical protein